MSVRVIAGDCLDVMPTLGANSIDSIVTDPPYGLLFMGKDWDHGIPGEHLWREALRVAKPGAHLLAFGGTRTFHRLMVAIEDAGWEIRDTIGWLYGSGFPKSLDVSKAIDSRKDWAALENLQRTVKMARDRLGISQSEAARRMGMIEPGADLGGGGFMWFETGRRLPTREQYPKLKAALGLGDECDAAFEAAEREVTGQHQATAAGQNMQHGIGGGAKPLPPGAITAPATVAARQWQGWGTALKPAWEPIIVARKPLRGTVAANVQQYGTGALNIDASRVGTDGGCAGAGAGAGANVFGNGLNGTFAQPVPGLGRWPANLIHDGSDEVVALFPETTTNPGVYNKPGGVGHIQYAPSRQVGTVVSNGDIGSAARFFKSAEMGDEEWLDVYLSLVPIARDRFSLQSLLGCIARSDAATLALPEGTRLNACPAPSTSATASESKRLAIAFITAMQDIGQRCLREWPHEKLSPSGSRVQVVATREQTGIMMITASHWRSDGSADPVTFSITPANSVHGEADSARRFIYCAKADREDRNNGCEGIEPTVTKGDFPALVCNVCGCRRVLNYKTTCGHDDARREVGSARNNNHPTVKPAELMAYLVRLVTPPGGTVLDPFAGSGSTGLAADRLQFNAILIELDPAYAAIAEQRIRGDAPLFAVMA